MPKVEAARFESDCSTLPDLAGTLSPSYSSELDDHAEEHTIDLGPSVQPIVDDLFCKSLSLVANGECLPSQHSDENVCLENNDTYQRFCSVLSSASAKNDDCFKIVEENGASISPHASEDMCSTRFVIGPRRLLRVQEVHGILGFGGISKVYRCSLQDREKQIVQVALKLYDPHICFVEAEAKLMLELCHPSVVGLHAAIDGLPCGLAFELCTGGDLESFLHGSDHHEDVRSYGVQTRLYAAQDLASALEYLHSKQIIHRGVMSKNCFLSQHPAHGILPRLKLGGLGFARQLADDPLTRGRATIRYLAPEVIISKTCGLSADVFSFGILFHELLSGQVPFSDTDEYNEGCLLLAICGGKRPSLDVFYNFAACAEICTVIDSCWESPARRPTASMLVIQIEYLMWVA